MSRLYAIRFINLNYGINGVYAAKNLTLKHDNKNSIVKLDNGKGKSVLIQLLTALHTKKQRRNKKDRPFSDFISTKHPTFIMAEHILSNGSHLIIGLMAKKDYNKELDDDLESDDNLRIYTFIGQCKTPCEYNIEHIPFIDVIDTNTINYKSFNECKRILEGFASKYKNDFFLYKAEKNQEIKKYTNKLEEYGIHTSDWEQIIYKLNSQEAGLDTFFEKYDKESDFIEDWILKNIEANLNKESDRIENIQKIFTDQVVNCYDDRTILENINIFNSYIEHLKDLKADSDECNKIQKDMDERTDYASMVLSESNRLQHEMDGLKKESEKELEELQEKLKLTIYQEQSQAYYKAHDELKTIEKKLETLNQKQVELRHVIETTTYDLKIIDLKEIQKSVDLLYLDLKQAEQAFKVEKKKESVRYKEETYVGSHLKRIYETELDNAEASLLKEEAKKTENREKIRQLSEQHKNIITKQENTKERLAFVKAKIDAFDIKEADYNNHYDESLSRNILKLYPDSLFGNLFQKLSNKIGEIESDTATKENLITDIKGQKEELAKEKYCISDQLQELNQRNAKEEQTLNEWNEQIEIRKEILPIFSMECKDIYEKEVILSRADSVINNNIQLTETARIKRSELIHEKKQVKIGAAFDLPNNVSKMFTEHGINYVRGSEWLQNNGESIETNTRTIENNPFLPFSLIMEEDDYEKLSKCDMVPTSIPIPIIIKKNICAAPMLTNSNIDFYLYYNKNLLDPEKLKSIIQELEAKIIKLNSRIDELELNRKIFEENRAIISTQDVTKEKIRQSESIIQDLKNEMNSLKEKEKECIKKTEELEESSNTLRNQIEKNKISIKYLAKKTAATSLLSKEYDEYCKQLKTLEKIEHDIRKLEESRSRIQNDQEKISEENDKVIDRITSLKANLEKNRHNYNKYIQYDSDIQEDKDIGIDICNRDLLIARYKALIETRSKEERGLESAYESCKERYNSEVIRLKNRAATDKIDQKEWQASQLTEHDRERLNHTFEEKNNELESTTNKINELMTDKGRSDANKDNALKKIFDKCNKEKPLSREDIPVLDFKDRRKALNEKSTNIAAKIKEYKNKGEVYFNTGIKLRNIVDVYPTNDYVLAEDISLLTEEELSKKTENAIRKIIELKKSFANKELSLKGKLTRLSENSMFYNIKEITNSIEGMKKTLSRPDRRTLSEEITYDIDFVNRLIRTMDEGLKTIKRREEDIKSTIQDYIIDVIKEIGKIDKTSRITINLNEEEKRVQMLTLRSPEWDEEKHPIRMKGFIEEVKKAGLNVALESNGNLNSIKNAIKKEVTIGKMFDYVIGLKNIKFETTKVSETHVQKLTWKDAKKNSGGESTLMSFTLLACIMRYMRREDEIGATDNDGSVLLLDNPFGKMTAAYMIDPLVKLSKATNVQFIAFTGIDMESILDKFDNIHSLKTVQDLSSGKTMLVPELSVSKREYLSNADITVRHNEQLTLDLN